MLDGYYSPPLSATAVTKYVLLACQHDEAARKFAKRGDVVKRYRDHVES